MRTVHFTIGISASGKTTWAKKFCKENNAIRINRDDLRASLFGLTLQEYFNNFSEHRDKENIITSLVFKMANQAIKEGKDVVIDNTHLQLKYIKEILNKIEGNVRFELVWILENPDVCIERDSLREISVGSEVIKRQSQQFNDLYLQEIEILTLIEERKKLNFKPVKQNSDLPRAICVDLDGTLALMGDHRGPYDWTKVGGDIINYPMWNLLDILDNSNDSLPESLKIKVIICTGRDGSAEKKTKEWLRMAGVLYDDFYIRKSGDNRKDSIVKREFLEDIVKKYYVLGVFDDRKQVKRMWVQSGIFVFDVNQFDEEF